MSIRDNVRVCVPRYLQIGKGSLSQLPEIIKILGSIKSPLIVTDKQMVQFGYVKKLQEVLNKAGLNSNVFDDTIPDPTDKVVLKGTTRAYTENNRLLIKNRMIEILNGLEKTFNAEIKLDYEDGYPPVINHKEQTELLKNSAKKIIPTGVQKPYLSMGGEDFSYFIQKVPGCF